MRLCGYGCGREAKFAPQKGMKKWCCEENWQQCPKMSIPWNKGLTKYNDIRVKRSSDKLLGHKVLEETREKIGITSRGRIPWNKGQILGPQSSGLIKKRTRNTHKKYNMITYYQKKYPLLFIVENIRENQEKEIEVKCKLCNQWFVPDKQQFHERVRQLTTIDGNDGSFFYCSEKCKNGCSIYGRSAVQLIKEDQIAAGHIKEPIYTSEEYSIWREEVFKRQKEELGYNECEYCGNRNLKELSVHHEKPQKTHPLLVLDPDNGIIACGANSEKKCHYKYGHPKDTECSTGYLAKVICI